MDFLKIFVQGMIASGIASPSDIEEGSARGYAKLHQKLRELLKDFDSSALTALAISVDSAKVKVGRDQSILYEGLRGRAGLLEDAIGAVCWEIGMIWNQEHAAA